MNKAFAPLEKVKRQFLPEDFKLSTWEAIQPYFEELLKRDLNNKQQLEKWLTDISELEAVISEDAI